jgi:hypothetical protein
MRALLFLALCGCGSSMNNSDGGADAGPPWLESAQIFVLGDGISQQVPCQTQICRHNENTDMTLWNGAMWLVHRTALSQKLGDNCSLHVYRSDDGGTTFKDVATIPPVPGRDLRDPSFYQVGSRLHIKALTRLPVVSLRDADTDTTAIEVHSDDGMTWSAPQPIAPGGWGLWRVKQSGGVYYSAAYQDGDLQVVLFSSTDGLTFTQGAPVYTVSADTPVETELSFLPSGRMLALVRTDGADADLLGADGVLHTHVCWAMPPYSQFDCPQVLDGVRLDGPLSFFWQGRLFEVARKHLPTGDRKRTALYELGGTLEGGPLTIKEWGELPSAGDTSYAGVAQIDDTRVKVSWYSGDLWLDEDWLLGMYDSTDIWTATIDLSKLK